MGGEWTILQKTDRWEEPVWAENGPFFRILTDGRSLYGRRIPFFRILTDGRSLYGRRMDHSSEY